MNEDLKHKAINLLKELGYTAYRISQDTGLSQSIIGQWLSGKVLLNQNEKAHRTHGPHQSGN